MSKTLAARAICGMGSRSSQFADDMNEAPSTREPIQGRQPGSIWITWRGR